MKLLFRLMAFASVFSTQSSLAEGTRFNRLAGSHLIANLENEETWSAEFSVSGVKYTCLECAFPVTAFLESITPYASEHYRSLSDRYLSERKIFCADLVINGPGRCLGTRPARMRGGALSGFVSKQDIASRREIEIVFFYHEREFGPELIRTKIMLEDGATLPNDASGMFREHMAKLTVFW